MQDYRKGLKNCPCDSIYIRCPEEANLQRQGVNQQLPKPGSGIGSDMNEHEESCWGDEMF